MFEKEAEEWVKKEFPLLDVEHTNLEESITEYRAFKDGATFGYNKANEWHDLRKNPDDLPKHRRGIDKMTDDLYYRKLESTSTSDLVDMLREKDRRIAELEEENAELKKKLDKIRNYLVYDIFDRFKYLENLLKISQEKQEELSKCIIEQQKTTGSLTDLIYELKAQIGKM